MTSVYAQHDVAMKWQTILHAKGWVAPAWPVENGGCGWTVLQRYIFTRERVAAGAPPVSPMGVQMCGPALIGYGSDEQKAHFLPRMLSGEHFWCQGYSEPEAGSDLASLQMEALDDGDDLICTGTKIWTTHADEANWIFCLVRTSKEDRPQKGNHLCPDRHDHPRHFGSPDRCPLGRAYPEPGLLRSGPRPQDPGRRADRRGMDRRQIPAGV